MNDYNHFIVFIYIVFLIKPCFNITLDKIRFLIIYKLKNKIRAK